MIIQLWRITIILIICNTSKAMSEMLAQVILRYINSNLNAFMFNIFHKNQQVFIGKIFILSLLIFKVNISGLRAATDTNRRTGRRVVWVFLLIVCFGVMVAQITDRVRHFLSEPVSVQVSVARNNSLLYPAVTVCNKVSAST